MDNPNLNRTQLSTITAYTDSDNFYLALDIRQLNSAAFDKGITPTTNYETEEFVSKHYASRGY